MYKEIYGNISELPPIIKPKFLIDRNFAIPACELYMLARAKKITPNVNKVKAFPEKRDFCHGINMMLENAFRLTSLFTRLLAFCHQDMVGIKVSVILGWNHAQ